ncbi:hypothetical protein SAMD00019534_091970 [Acytostelium subglobosum LB1]|uniref:hypothetical protein n=1 Tax=Acytostelium subglobosum LB1 TaxID=1410327 RepID=UPI000644809F|nr:hypothetical protein SAMD00019534_091970 [Acytostelium subglobosum LB1]GAM26022.1 hypothetical protein SAMD00019534_091970 [Acytostelium subglobosum LB1]|eukprot:XP_012751065.1 hypothetical protein SAMD00019534_091970 [Acytostelium subglobosum LB1]
MFIADADDKDSIEMMLADGLIKCLHTACFFTTLKSLSEHLLRKGGDHQCADRNSCPGCLRSDLLMTRYTLPNDRTTKSFVCLHDGCSKEFEDFGLLQKHCKKMHQCRTFASCLNQQRYRTTHFTAAPDDLESIKMLTARGLIQCLHSTCTSYFKNTRSIKKHFRIYHPGHDLSSIFESTLKRKRSMMDGEEEDDEEDDKEDEEEDDEDIDMDQDNGQDGEDDEDVSLILTFPSSPTNHASNVKIKCLHSNCDKSFAMRYQMLHHNRKDHQCTDHQSCQGCMLRRLCAMRNDSASLPKFKCHHDGCPTSLVNYSSLRKHCRFHHRCTKTYAACPNYQTHQKTSFFADPDDTESISMLTARGLFQCPHTSCGHFMATNRAKNHHLAKEHQCPDPASCQGCIDHHPRRWTGAPPNDNKQEGKFKCLHDADCTKSFISSSGMYYH